MVALMLAGSGLGMLGALVYPQRTANPPPWRDADRPGESVPQQVRLNMSRPIGHDRRVSIQRTNGVASRILPAVLLKAKRHREGAR
jgi:hypothetical protein